MVFSGSYLYFYKQRDDLMPFHYIYIMGILSLKTTDRQTFLQQSKGDPKSNLEGLKEKSASKEPNGIRQSV